METEFKPDFKEGTLYSIQFVRELLGLSQQETAIVRLYGVEVVGSGEVVIDGTTVIGMVDSGIIYFRKMVDSIQQDKVRSGIHEFLRYYDTHLNFVDFITFAGMDIYTPFRQKQYNKQFLVWARDHGFSLIPSDFAKFLDYTGYFTRTSKQEYVVLEGSVLDKDLFDRSIDTVEDITDNPFDEQITPSDFDDTDSTNIVEETIRQLTGGMSIKDLETEAEQEKEVYQTLLNEVSKETPKATSAIEDYERMFDDDD